MTNTSPYVTMTVRYPLWWRFFYFPLALLAARLGWPVNPEKVAATAVKALRIYVGSVRVK